MPMKVLDLINKKVKIIPLELEGYIKELRVMRTGTMCLVRYLYNMDMYEHYFYTEEIEIIGTSHNSDYTKLLRNFAQS